MPRLSNRLREVQKRAAFVRGRLGDKIICQNCKATCDTYAEKCFADLSEACEGFNVIEEARSEYFLGNSLSSGTENGNG